MSNHDLGHARRYAAVLSLGIIGLAAASPAIANDETRNCQLQAEVSVSKHAEPHDPMRPGLVITYVLSAVNNGNSTSALKIVDDMTDTLDDATLTGDFVPSSGTITRSGNAFAWDLSLDPTLAATVRYSVTIKPWAQLGDGHVRNAITVESEGAQARSCAIEEVLPPQGGAETGDGSLAGPTRPILAAMTGAALAGVAGFFAIRRMRKLVPADE